MSVQRVVVVNNRPQKSKGVALLLCLLLGGIGAHHFYLGNYIRAVLYMLFFWTFIPAIISLFDLVILLFKSESSLNR